jgi:tRNA(Ile)-lysidine synthase
VARNLRYEFLRKVTQKVGDGLIATGHHRDDQAETVLLNLFRGSGARGLSAMQPRQADIIRPLLCLTREEINTYCCIEGLLPRSDESNGDFAFRRNRLRHELIPWLRQEYNPALTAALCRTAEILADENQFVRAYVQQHQLEWTCVGKAGFYLKATVFFELPNTVQRELILLLLEKLSGDLKGIGFSHVEQIRELFLQNSGSRQISLPRNLTARRNYDELWLGLRETYSEGPPILMAPRELACPGDTCILNQRLMLRCVEGLKQNNFANGLGPMKVAFDRDALELPLIVRTRRQGDRFRSLGAPGSRKLKEILIDRKVLAAERDKTALVCDQRGIIWIVGHCRSERARLASMTKSYIIIEAITQEATQYDEKSDDEGC